MDYIDHIENNNYFEIVSLLNDDLSRNKFYSENVKRNKQKSTFENYNDYLVSLNMKAEIKPFCNVYIDRITQLINKTNQFNLTTKRYKLNEIESISKDDTYISLYGKLEDKFGDNGVTGLCIIKIKQNDSKAVEIDSFLSQNKGKLFAFLLIVQIFFNFNISQIKPKFIVVPEVPNKKFI